MSPCILFSGRPVVRHRLRFPYCASMLWSTPIWAVRQNIPVSPANGKFRRCLNVFTPQRRPAGSRSGLWSKDGDASAERQFRRSQRTIPVLPWYMNPYSCCYRNWYCCCNIDRCWCNTGRCCRRSADPCVAPINALRGRTFCCFLKRNNSCR